MSACTANTCTTPSSLDYLPTLLGILFTTALTMGDLLFGFLLGPLNGQLASQRCITFNSVVPASSIMHGTQNSITLC